MTLVQRIRNFLATETLILSNKERWYLVLGTGLFIFLFLLFFQPFGVNNYDPKETITLQFFLVMVLMGVVVSAIVAFSELLIFPLFIKEPKVGSMILWVIWSIIWLSTGVFFLYNYLGNWHGFIWPSYVEFIGNIGTMGLIPVIGVIIYLRQKQLRISLEEAHSYSHKPEDTDLLITLEADNQKDKFSIPLKYLIFIESEDNYISIHHLKDEIVTKTLLRKSLKSVQSESTHPALLRIHRSYIINLVHLQKIAGNRNKQSVFINHRKEAIPVSRLYMDEVSRLIS